MGEVIEAIVTTFITDEFGNVPIWHIPGVVIGFFAFLYYVRNDQPLKESTGKKVALIFMGLGLLEIAFIGLP